MFSESKIRPPLRTNKKFLDLPLLYLPLTFWTIIFFCFFFQVGGSSHHLNFDKLCEITPLKILSKINSVYIGGKCPGATVLISLKVYISLWLK